MASSSYAFKNLDFNGYSALFLTVKTNSFLRGEKNRYVPAMAHYINGKKNTYVRLSHLPTKINSGNFFYFIHAQDESLLNEFVREHQDIDQYLRKLNEYLKSNK